MYMVVALLVWVAWIINPNSLNYRSPRLCRGDFFYLAPKPPLMRLLLLFVLCVCVIDSSAQDCGSNALMKKGGQLEYMVYTPGYRNDKALRMVYEVTNVADSAGSTFSTIIKKGIGIKDPENDHYEKTIRLQCDGKNLLIPYDFYSPDTTWFNDRNMSIIKRHLFQTGNAPLQDPNAYYMIPLALEGITDLPVAAKQVKQGVTTTGELPAQGTDGWHKLKGESGIWTKSEEVLLNYKNIKVAGKDKVTTAAGTFDCYIIGVDCDFQFNGASFVTKYSMRYNPEVGLVRMEIDLFSGNRKISKAGSVELISVKK